MDSAHSSLTISVKARNSMTHFPSFAVAFEAAHGSPPYTWQESAWSSISSGEWPTQVAVPTGLGKTSMIFVCLYELARQAHFDQKRSTPLRIFHVVDRRTIIDEVALYARQLASMIDQSKPGSPLHYMKGALLKLTGPGDDQPVVVAGLHGAAPDDRTWMRAAGCTIATMTSHQFVSRILFRGIGVSPGVRPIAAGICGTDRVVLFDEPHLSEQAVHTILSAEKLQTEAPLSPLVPPSRTILLGATIPRRVSEATSGKRLTLDPGAEKSTSARTRLCARRTVELSWVAHTDGAYQKAMVKAVRDAWRAGVKRTVVFVNSVQLAQKLFGALSKNPATPISLVTSRFRPIDRRGSVGEGERLSADSLTVITTQALEVGVDLTFDVMISEMCPWPSLVQRLGRLNRDGRSAHGQGIVLASWNTEKDAPHARAASAAVYGEEAIGGITSFLRTVAESTSSKRIDVGFTGLQDLAQRPGFDSLEPVSPRIATLHRDLLPVLTQTRPVPSPDLRWEALIVPPDEQPTTDVAVAWRSDLCVFDSVLTRARVSSQEFVQVPRAAIAVFLDGRSSTGDLSDLDSSGPDESGSPGKTPFTDWSLVRVWDASAEQWSTPTGKAQVLAASRVLFHPTVGGYSTQLGWTGVVADTPLPDMSLPAAAARLGSIDHGLARQRATARVDVVVSADSLRAIDGSTEWAERFPSSMELVEQLEALEGSARDPEEVAAEVESAVLEFVLTDLLRSPASGWDFQVDVLPGAVSVVHLHRREPASSAAETAVGLDDHSRQVGAWCAADAARIGLDAVAVDILSRAAGMHDAGKSRLQWQRRMNNSGDELLAKPVGPVDASRAALLEPGWRHEVFSTQLLSRDAGLLERHLVGSHHGWFRPVIPPVKSDSDCEVRYPALLEHADDYVNLNQMYGPWGLALLESILRLADWRASSHPEPGVSFNGLVPSQALGAQVSDSLRNAESTSEPRVEYRLEGLIAHPMTGWFVAAGLLAAAAELGDSEAALRWQSRQDGSQTVPGVPILESELELNDIVSFIVTHDDWSGAQKLADALDFEHGLKVENQKWVGADNVRPMLVEALTLNNRLLTALATDLQPVQFVGKARTPSVAMPVPQFANNSSYPAVAVARSAAEAGSVDQAIQAALDAVSSLNAGFERVQCDGGMDRPVIDPGVNGLTEDGGRFTKSAVAPLVVFGVSRFGVGQPRGAGADGSSVTLPLPLIPLSAAELQALLSIGRSRTDWEWEGSGLQWIYRADRLAVKDHGEAVWDGVITTRTKPYLK